MEGEWFEACPLSVILRIHLHSDVVAFGLGHELAPFVDVGLGLHTITQYLIAARAEAYDTR